MLPNPWVIIGVLVAWLGSLGAVGFWQNSAGHTSEKVAWQQREVQQQAEYDQKYRDLEAKYRAQEQDGAQKLADASADYERRLQDVQTKNDSLASELRAGTLRLRDKYARASKACKCGVSKTSTGSGGRDGTAPGDISAEASGFLLRLSGDADKTADQLAACQQVVVKDREIINGK